MTRPPLISLILIGFLATQIISQETLKMMRIYGRVTGETLTEENIDEDCEQTCFNREDCILAFFNEQDYCILMDFNSTQSLEVVEANKQDGLYVSFKTTLPDDTCPAYNLISPVVNLGEDPIRWTRTGDIWSFKKCVGDWKMFQRPDTNITVCMQTFRVSGMRRSKAFEFCENLGYDVTGLTANEAEWIYNKYYTILEYNNGLFMDGERDCDPPGTNCTNFKWTDGYTEGNDFVKVAGLSWTGYNSQDKENCLAVGRFYGSINDIYCDDSPTHEGVVCGYRLE